MPGTPAGHFFVQEWTYAAEARDGRERLWVLCSAYFTAHRQRWMQRFAAISPKQTLLYQLGTWLLDEPVESGCPVGSLLVISGLSW
ncbi:hypothetical protein [Sedimenticola hydrogenitrophicus]|uniref:hypothetical protein n=1 Tax=Sedimenticola hydrogenitrophicus TaxID=2967975 RepID=UPI0023B11738|nr:hypothetical protein [Sedimenticola hydrogenitrophicus]